MSEMLDRVARAIYEKRNGPGCSPWVNRPKGHKDPYLADARAAIEATREPTPAMIAAGMDEVSDVTVSEPKAAAWDALRFHRAMIDEALK